MNRDIKIKRCKCCRGAAEIYRFTGGVCYIRCSKCGIQTPFLRVDEAIRCWNMTPRRARREARINGKKSVA